MFFFSRFIVIYFDTPAWLRESFLCYRDRTSSDSRVFFFVCQPSHYFRLKCVGTNVDSMQSWRNIIKFRSLGVVCFYFFGSSSFVKPQMKKRCGLIIDETFHMLQQVYAQSDGNTIHILFTMVESAVNNTILFLESQLKYLPLPIPSRLVVQSWNRDWHDLCFFFSVVLHERKRDSERKNFLKVSDLYVKVDDVDYRPSRRRGRRYE